MKNKVWLFTAALLLFTAGCGKTDLTEKEINGDEQKTAGISDTDETESEIDSSASEKMEAAEEKYIWKEITLQFPSYLVVSVITGSGLISLPVYVWSAIGLTTIVVSSSVITLEIISKAVEASPE